MRLSKLNRAEIEESLLQPYATHSTINAIIPQIAKRISGIVKQPY